MRPVARAPFSLSRSLARSFAPPPPGLLAALRTLAQAKPKDSAVEPTGRRRRALATRYYSLLCGQPIEKVERDLDRDNFLSAYEALEYGLIDRVIEWSK